MKPGFLWICDLQLDLVRSSKVWHLMPTKECACVVASLAIGAVQRDPDLIFVELPGTSCLSARCTSKLRKKWLRTLTSSRYIRWVEELTQN